MSVGPIVKHGHMHVYLSQCKQGTNKAEAPPQCSSPWLHALPMLSQCPHCAFTVPLRRPRHALTTPSPRCHCVLTVPSLCLHNAFTMPSPCPQCALTMGPPQCPHSGPTMLQISTCNDLTSSSCEVTADGVGAVQGFTQLSDTSYQIDVQVRDPALCL